MSRSEALPFDITGQDSDELAHFRFLDLPRELRDWCYNYMTISTRTHAFRNKLRFRF